MTKQDAYETIRAWLTRPGARRAYQEDWVNSSGETQGICRYETQLDGAPQRCAVGCLLSRKDLDRSMASFDGGIEGLFEEYGVPVYLMGIADGQTGDPYGEIKVFLQRFQLVHDSSANWDGITGEFLGADRLDDIARDYDLTVVE